MGAGLILYTSSPLAAFTLPCQPSSSNILPLPLLTSHSFVPEPPLTFLRFLKFYRRHLSLLADVDRDTHPTAYCFSASPPLVSSTQCLILYLFLASRIGLLFVY